MELQPKDDISQHQATTDTNVLQISGFDKKKKADER